MLGGVGNMKGEKQMIYKNIMFKADGKCLENETRQAL